MRDTALDTTNKKKARALETVIAPGPAHWVGDGFYVRTVFSPLADAQTLSPFLLLDHADPKYFPPAARRRGVGEHPHRGFETVTFAYRGEVEHRDSTGAGGRIGPGDVQWMTAASGVVHEEMHSQRFTEAGGEFEMVQLWVNLPAVDKMTAPRYQPLLAREFPRLPLGAAEGRLVAGRFGSELGPAKTHTPMAVLDLAFSEDGLCEMELPSSWTALACVLEGDVQVAEGQPIAPRHVAVFKREDEGTVRLRGSEGARVLMLSGEPLNEPVVAYGPFVMNTREEIAAAFRDYQSGKMGHL